MIGIRVFIIGYIMIYVMHFTLPLSKFTSCGGKVGVPVFVAAAIF
jgi:hypothetical protein